MNRKERLFLDSILNDLVFDKVSIEKNTIDNDRLLVLLQTRIDDLRKLMKGEVNNWPRSQNGLSYTVRRHTALMILN